MQSTPQCFLTGQVRVSRLLGTTSMPLAPACFEPRQTHSAGGPIRNYAPLARLRKPSPDRLIIPTPRLLVLQNHHARNRTRYHGAAISKTSIQSVRRVQKEESALQRANALPAMRPSRFAVHLLTVRQAKVSGQERPYHLRVQKSNVQPASHIAANTACSFRSSQLPDAIQPHLANT
jgi:hypothetical protein